VTRRQSANGRVASTPADWAALQYQPSGAALLACSRHGCGAKYLDDDPGHQAHVAVFGHSPKPREPARPEESTEGESP
jgi:hypothetical protein